MDTVEEVFRRLPPECLENLKYKLVHYLIRKKVFRPFRAFDKYCQIAFDATELHAWKEEHLGTYKVSNQGYFSITSENLKILKSRGLPLSIIDHLRKFEGKKWKGTENFFTAISYLFSKEEWEQWREQLRKYVGNTTWFVFVLEAKLVTSNGFSISIGSEWIENDQEYDKQDCESKAFTRLSEKLKKEFPLLPVLVLADGLYPNQTVLEKCKQLKWMFILVLKDGNLPSVWKEIERAKNLNPEQSANSQSKQCLQKYYWVNNIEYQKHTIHYGECIETFLNEDFEVKKKNKFAYISNQTLDQARIQEFIKTGRKRQKIENEGFNIQKNHGFKVKHKISRDAQAYKNWYQCLQIAHLLCQLMILAQHFKKWKKQYTFIFLWKFLASALARDSLAEIEIDSLINKKIQFRYQ